MTTDRKQAWEENFKKIKEEFPSVGEISWSHAISQDSSAFASVLGDIIKAEGKRSRPGKRPSLSRPAAEEELSRLLGDNHSDLDFTRTFKALTHGRSVRGIANKVGIGQTTVHALLHGKSPSFEQMEKIAVAYKKDPSFFLEYRIAYVLLTIDQFLADSPETATNWFLKFKGRGRLKIK